jgi:tetratricopeptide (TPR) repeat protein
LESALRALALLAAGACVRAHAPSEKQAAPHAIVFIEDDYPRALALARSRHVPLFVDAWASWCHSCLSMRAYVFPDAALHPFADRFVWLSLDTERPSSAPVVAKLDVRVLPTFYVIDPGTEREVLRWSGSLTAVELSGLLDESLAASGSGGPRGPLAVDARVARLSDAKRLAECVTVAADELPRMPAGTALADVLRSAMGCAENLAPDAPERARLAEIVAVGRRVVSDPSQPILADDRSDLYDYLVSALRSLGRPDEAMALARDWAALLATEAGRAPTPAARAVFDAHRLLAYRALGEPERAVPMLEQSERDLPDDYNPPARLATVYLDMKRYDDALAAAKRALDRAYGPRKLRLWSLEADILVGRSDRQGARRVLREALDFAATTPLTSSYPKLRDAIARRLADLEGPPQP